MPSGEWSIIILLRVTCKYASQTDSELVSTQSKVLSSNFARRFAAGATKLFGFAEEELH